MSSVVVRPGQTLADIAVEHLGGMERVFDLATLNGLAITDELTPGQSLELPEIENSRAKRFHDARTNSPAANIGETVRDGIGFWTIGDTFEVQ